MGFGLDLHDLTLTSLRLVKLRVILSLVISLLAGGVITGLEEAGQVDLASPLQLESDLLLVPQVEVEPKVLDLACFQAAEDDLLGTLLGYQIVLAYRVMVMEVEGLPFLGLIPRLALETCRILDRSSLLSSNGLVLVRIWPQNILSL